MHLSEKDFNYGGKWIATKPRFVSYNRATTLIWQTEHLFSTHVGVSRFHDIDVIWIKAHFTTEDRHFAYISLTRYGHEKWLCYTAATRLHKVFHCISHSSCIKRDVSRISASRTAAFRFIDHLFGFISIHRNKYMSNAITINEIYTHMYTRTYAWKPVIT